MNLPRPVFPFDGGEMRAVLAPTPEEVLGDILHSVGDAPLVDAVTQMMLHPSHHSSSSLGVMVLDVTATVNTYRTGWFEGAVFHDFDGFENNEIYPGVASGPSRPWWELADKQRGGAVPDVLKPWPAAARLRTTWRVPIYDALFWPEAGPYKAVRRVLRDLYPDVMAVALDPKPLVRGGAL